MEKLKLKATERRPTIVKTLTTDPTTVVAAQRIVKSLDDVLKINALTFYARPFIWWCQKNLKNQNWMLWKCDKWSDIESYVRKDKKTKSDLLPLSH